jgi:hypothetical protein
MYFSSDCIVLMKYPNVKLASQSENYLQSHFHLISISFPSHFHLISISFPSHLTSM